MVTPKPKQPAVTNQTPKSIHIVPEKRKVRLLIVRKGTEKGDISAFKFARENVINSYEIVDKGRYEIIKCDVSTAKELVAEINKHDIDSIRSLDIFSHGGENALYMTVGTPRFRGDGGIVDTIRDELDRADRWIFRNAALYRSNAALMKDIAVVADSTSLDSIEMNRFTENVKVELHGCNTAKPSEGGFLSDPDPADNFAGEFSKLLFEAGHSHSVVIGSPVQSNPSINGDKTTIKQQDYRHGRRCIFRNGEKIGEIKSKGHFDERQLIGM
jgi:hypothetical protein